MGGSPSGGAVVSSPVLVRKRLPTTWLSEKENDCPLSAAGPQSFLSHREVFAWFWNRPRPVTCCLAAIPSIQQHPEDSGFLFLSHFMGRCSLTLTALFLPWGFLLFSALSFSFTVFLPAHDPGCSSPSTGYNLTNAPLPTATKPVSVCRARYSPQ